MFDFSFAELMVVAIVALVVIGPERLPHVARTAGHMWGKLQRYVQNVKTEISNDMAMEEARKLQANIRNDLGAVQASVKETELSLAQQMLQARYTESSSDVQPNSSVVPPNSVTTEPALSQANPSAPPVSTNKSDMQS